MPCAWNLLVCRENRTGITGIPAGTKIVVLERHHDAGEGAGMRDAGSAGSGAVREAAPSGETQLADVLTAALAEGGRSARWTVRDDEFWKALRPQGYAERSQGWKLHISATVNSAPDVLARSLPVLLDTDAAFKFAGSLERVARLNARHTARGQSGKFITVYPASDEQAVELAEKLHRATSGLSGPYILSDRPYAPGSLVHYRYGAFVQRRKLSNDGMYSWLIFDPDGNPVPDQRLGRYLPPDWAPCPFPQPEQAASEASGSTASADTASGGTASGGTASGGTPSGRTASGYAASGSTAAASGDAGVLLAGRFQVQGAIRHLNKGGVYRGVDTETGAEVIIKEARPHVEEDDTGRDVRDLLRAEAVALELVAPAGSGPRVRGLFEHAGHLFLAEDLVPGVPLQRWVLDRIRKAGWARHVSGAVRAGRLLAELMVSAHNSGLIIRDFTPGNVMVRPDGHLQLIDLELACPAATAAGERGGVGTPGFAAPEQMTGKAGPDVTADYFSLGACICFVVTGSAPAFMPDTAPARPVRERLGEWLAVRAEQGGIPDELQSLILALTEDEPADRMSATRAAAILRALGERPGAPAGRRRRNGGPDAGDAREVSTPAAPWGPDQHRQATEGIVTHLLDTMGPAGADRLWPVSTGQGEPDPCAVHLGAAGVLGVLTRAFEVTGDERLPAALTTIGQWIARRSGAEAERPPALYFGAAGTAWALYDAGRVAADERLIEQGLAMARELPVRWDNPDLTHGTAGLALTSLHFWLETGEDGFADRLVQSADDLVGAAAEEPGGLIWGTPAAFDSRLAGGRFHGFAHGTAGVGYALLVAGMATGRPDYLALATRAGETLLDAAISTRNETGQVLQWGAGPGDPPTAPYWCHGAAGIGAFLIRLNKATGDSRFADAAEGAARAMMENSWRGVLGQCHGLAGNGECLLDMAEMTGSAGSHSARLYQQWATQLARLTFASRARRGDRVLFPDEAGEPTASWADGMSGMLAFLLRLKHRSPRLWMPDSPLHWQRP
jgi:hypothetical protein